MKKEEFVSISKDWFRLLVEDAATLHALAAGGVDNWGGYEHCDFPTDEEIDAIVAEFLSGDELA